MGVLASLIGVVITLDRYAVFRCAAFTSRCLTIAFAELARVIFDNWGLVGGTGGYFLKAINPDTNRPLETLRGGTLFFYLAF